MNLNLVVLAVCGVLLMTLTGCCCAMSDLADGGYYDDYSGNGGGNPLTDLFASEAGQYEGSDCWSSAGCAGVQDGTYTYEEYDQGTGSYDYYQQ